MGPDDEPTRLTSFDMFTYIYGGRVAAAANAWDGVDAYFHNGGQVVYFQRMVDGGTEATADPSPVTGNTGDTARVKHPGAYGNDVTLDVVTTPGSSGLASKGKKSLGPEVAQSSFLTYDASPLAASGGLMATVKLAGTIVATSTPFTTNGELSDWLNAGLWIDPDFADTSGPAQVGTVAFTGGSDGNLPCTNVVSLTDALGHLSKELGPGQLSAPGKTDVNMHGALLAAAEATNRVALLDTGLGDDMSTCMAKAAALRGAAQDRYGSLWAPWADIPGIAGGTTRKVPWSPIQPPCALRMIAAVTLTKRSPDCGVRHSG
jgi:hypothetical protein